MICGDGRPSLRAQGANSSPELEAVLQRALASDPGDRYRDGAAFAAALREARRRRARIPVAKLLLGAALASLAACVVLVALRLGGTTNGDIRPVTPAAEPRDAAPEAPPESEQTPKAPSPVVLPWERTYPEARGVAFVDETHLVVATREELIHVDLGSGQQVHRVALPSPLVRLGGRLAHLKQHLVVLDADWRSFSVVRDGPVSAAALSPAGDVLAYGMHSVALVGKAGVEFGDATKFLHQAEIQRLALSPSHLAACSGKTVTWWNLSTSQQVHSVDRDVDSIAFDPLGQSLLVGTKQGEVLALDLETAHPTRYVLPETEDVLALTAHAGRVAGVAYMSKGRRLLSVGRNGSQPERAALWSRTGASLWRSPPAPGGFTDLAVSSRETHVALLNAKTWSVRVLRLPPLRK